MSAKLPPKFLVEYCWDGLLGSKNGIDDGLHHAEMLKVVEGLHGRRVVQACKLLNLTPRHRRRCPPERPDDSGLTRRLKQPFKIDTEHGRPLA